MYVLCNIMLSIYIMYICVQKICNVGFVLTICAYLLSENQQNMTFDRSPAASDTFRSAQFSPLFLKHSSDSPNYPQTAWAIRLISKIPAEGRAVKWVNEKREMKETRDKEEREAGWGEVLGCTGRGRWVFVLVFIVWQPSQPDAVLMQRQTKPSG